MRLTGRVYRAHNPRWSFEPHSGKGAARFGGRFNPKGTEALYTSLRFETAWLEAQQGFPFKAQPLTICAYTVDCDDIADLTDPAELARLGIAASDLSCAWEHLAAAGHEPPSWAVARRLLEHDVAGILLPSFAPAAQPGDINAIFWRWSAERPHRVLVIDNEGRLPKDDSSWR